MKLIIENSFYPDPILSVKLNIYFIIPSNKFSLFLQSITELLVIRVCRNLLGK